MQSRADATTDDGECSCEADPPNDGNGTHDGINERGEVSCLYACAHDDLIAPFPQAAPAVPDVPSFFTDLPNKDIIRLLLITSDHL